MNALFDSSFIFLPSSFGFSVFSAPLWLKVFDSYAGAGTIAAARAAFFFIPTLSSQ